ncbi:MAG: insulinase family protein [Lentisphaerae bacterium]|nr:insulinase family protein [Lentisphaerota bacterium]
MKPSLATLDNGLRVVMAPCEAESVAFGILIDSGSRHEPEELGGISHFIEHMLFKGTPSRKPIDISRAIEGRGGNFNAYTGEEGTCFFAHLPSDYLSEAMDILSDMYLNASIPAGEFRREKQVILEEIKMYSDEPDSVAQENLQRSIFPRNQLGAPVAGSERTLAPMTPATLRKYIATHYLPHKTVISVAGAFNSAALVKAVEKAFAPLDDRARRVRGTFAAQPVDFSYPPVSEMIASRDVKQTQLALGYRTFGIQDKRKYALTVMDAILGRGMSSRLFQSVREKRGLSYDISSRAQFFSDAGMFGIAAGLDPSKAEEALATIDRELTRIKTRKVPEEELERTKEFLIGNFRLSHEKVLSKMLFHGSTTMAFGRLVTTTEQIKEIRKVTPEDVIEVAREVLVNDNRSVSWVVPTPT